MAKSLGGFSHRELQGVGSHITLPGGGGVGEQAAAMHSGTPAAETGSGRAEDSYQKSYRMGNEARQADEQAKQDQHDRRNESSAENDYRVAHDQDSNEDQETGLNNLRYEISKDPNDGAGATQAANRVQDTDALLAKTRGDAEGTEYAAGSGGGTPTAIPGTGTKSMAPGGRDSR